MAYKLVDHTADLGIEVEAGSLGDLFGEAGRAFTDCVTEIETIGHRRHRSLSVASEGLEPLLVDWLSELLFVFETSGELFSVINAEVSESGGRWQVTAAVQGEEFDSDRHPLKVPVKAVTYHGLHVKRGEDGWTARVIFDI